MVRALLGSAKANKGIAVAVAVGVLFAGAVAVEASGAREPLLGVVGVETSSQETGGTTVCHSPPGNPGNAHAISVTDEELAEHLAHGDVSGECAGAVAPLEAGAAGDVPEGKVAICHAPPENPGNSHTLVVGEESAATHLDHGDVEGPCAESLRAKGRGRPEHAGLRGGRAGVSAEGATEKIGVCHKGRSMAVPSEALPDHLGHGDTVGACGQQAELN